MVNLQELKDFESSCDLEALERQLLKEYNKLYYNTKRRKDPKYKSYQRDKQKQYYDSGKKTRMKPEKEIKHKEIKMKALKVKSDIVVKFDYDDLIVEI